MSRFLRIWLCFALTLATFSFIAAPQAAHAAVGDVDTSVTLNGSTQYAWVADDNSLDVANALTVEAWVKPTSISTCGSSDTCIILNKENSYELAIYNGTYQHAILGTSTGAWVFQDTGVKAVINEWHHVAITRALNTYTTKFYLDGVLAATDSNGDGAGTSTISNSIYPFTIGARSSNGVTFTSKFTGQIDEVKVWGVERSATNVVSDMSNWGPTNTSGLQLYYDFNDVSGSPDTVVNRVSGATSASTLSLGNSPTVSDVKTTDTTTAPGYTILKFTRSYLNANGGWKVPSGVSSISTVLVGGGGGGGMRAGGGGGAGGYVQDSNLAVTQNSFEAITVGQGGPLSGSNAVAANYQGVSGQSSILGSHYTAIGGGGGGGATGTDDTYRSAKSGGSGGGASGSQFVANVTAAVGTSTQSSYGGNGFGNSGGNGSDVGGWPAGGGGGAGSAGGIGTGSTAGKGGSGKLDPILGLCLATGGGGGINTGGTPGAGGDCGGISNPNGDTGTAGFATPPPPLANSGSGGGGAGWNSGGGTDINGGSGASGVIIIKYKNLFGTSVTISVNPKKTTKSAGATPITATTTSTGTVTFYANYRVINGCLNVAASGTTATCNWRPITQGQVTLSATYTSNDPLYSGTAAATSFVTSVGKRTTAR
jgi:hypothetical protein